ncbi:IS66 family insertion sequence element accessory protein TnpB [Faecalibaculum rodentium]|uniref:Transposase n=10 Tax=Faecalibaculum rodentium TaxID=1702221 RepID=A0A140DUB4_9FIRM|nr:IS66 family insertion sequence element accessory protein TnpB [Faecalibaculum rodentium]AMK54241.1 hypothetical protein AALO17_11070 [Faecalibaculum rodentium]
MTGLDDISQLYLVTEPVDFRKGIDGLGTYVQSILNTDPFQNAMFVFTNKRHNKLKLLHYDGTGFWLLHKQLSKGTFKWRMNSLDPFLEISQQQLDWLLEGLDINQKRAFRPVKPQYI